MSRNKYDTGLLNFYPVKDFSIFAGFSCCSQDAPNNDLDDFIHNDAERHVKDKMAVTYAVFWKRESAPIAFFTLQNDALKVEMQDYPYTSFPAVKIGRLGVSVDMQGMGIGTSLLTAIKSFMCHDNRTGCRYITLDAYNIPRVIAFYERNDFVLLKKPHRDRKLEPMCFDLATYFPE